MTEKRQRLSDIYDIARQAAIYTSAADTLEWDERTGMPIAGGDHRAAQVAALRTHAHAIATDPGFGDLLSQSDDELDVAPESVDAGNLRLLRRDFDQQSKLPSDLVHQTATLTSKGQQAWQAARSDNDFASFAPLLKQILSLKKQAGEIFAASLRHPGGDDSNGGNPTGGDQQADHQLQAYDGLLDQYEPGMTAARVAEIFDSLRQPLVQLIQDHPTDRDDPDVALMRREYAIGGQRELSRWAAETIGFDFARGRLDETTHPFCTTLGPHDIRILSRYESNWLPGGLYGSLHEAGHGMYEQGLPTEWFGLPAGTYRSLGVHESQSRLWENQIGRSLGFIELCIAKMRQIFGSTVDFEAASMHRGVNTVSPSLIRVEADEATYNLHIMIRFDLERALIDGSLSVDDLPGAWNQRYRTDLGLDVPSDTLGVLQDVHWSAGLVGYFPTYTIGNLLSAQLFDAAAADCGLDVDQLRIEDFGNLRQWLAKHVFRHGRLKTTDEIASGATTGSLSDESLVNYLQSKHPRS